MLTCLYDVVGLFLAWIYESMYLFACLYAYMLGFMSFHVYVLNFYMFACMFLCLYGNIYASKSFCVQIYALYMFHVIFHVLVRSMPCSCLDLGYVWHAMSYCSPFVTLSFFLVFWPIGLDPIQTLWSSPLSIHLGPYHRVWITHFVCLCLLASMIYACVSLSCSRLCHA